MSKSTKNICLCLIIIFSAFLIIGCAGNKTGDSGKKEISFWTIQLSPTYDDYINGVIAGFEAEHPDVKIRWTDVPHMALQQKLLNAMAAGTPPDVVNLNIDSFQLYAEKDALLNLDNHISP
jgi:putative chitobiose transport system substrate-binding protein